MLLKNVKIKNKIMIIVGFLVILLIIISLTAYTGLNNMKYNSNVILDHAYGIEDAGDLQANMADLVMPVNNYLITGDLAQNSEEFENNLNSVNELLEKFRKKDDISDEEIRMLSEISKHIERIKSYAERIFNIREIQVNEQGAVLMEEMDEDAVNAVGIAEGFHNLIKDHMDEAAGNSAKTSNIVLLMLIIISAFSIIFGILLGTLIGRSINVPLRMLIDKLKNIAEEEGDLTSRLDIDSRDELGEVSIFFNKFIKNIHDLVARVLVASQTLGEAVQQIAAGNENLSQRTTEQASSLEEISSTIEETTAVISQNADNSDNASKTSLSATNKAVEGNNIVKEAVKSIDLINETSKKISDIISVINEIAFQTNLLALNAAVEAARAGESGRGFAVVATEVRNLAQRSGNAAKEIETLIKDSVEKVETGTELVKKSGESLQEILEAVKEVSRLISEIAASSAEQKSAMMQVNHAIAELDEMTQSNASLVEETASASEEMGNQAKDLLELIQNFKISEVSDSKTNINI